MTPTSPSSTADLDATERPPERDTTVAFVMWGDLFEDFYDTIGVSLETFRTRLEGGWLFGYTEALARAGVRTVLVGVSARVAGTTRFAHEPTGTSVVILAAPRRHRWMRSLIRRLPRRKALSSLVSYLSVPALPLRRALREERAGVLLTQEYEHARFDVLVLLGRLWRLPVFATFQGGDRIASKLERPVRPLTVRAAAGLIIASGRERERVAAAYGVPRQRIAPIPNAVDVAAYQPMERAAARRLLAIDDDARVVEWHGRVTVRRKGLDVLCDAWSLVCQQGSERRLLLLAGGGPDSEDLRRRLAALPEGTVRWRDEYISRREELLPYPSAADIYVLPSRHEGFPVAPIEAMAGGLPLVAADAPGISDILVDGEESGGIVVPVDDAEALAAALGVFLDDDQRRARAAAAARRRVESAYALEVVGAQLQAFLFPNRRR